MTLDECRDLIQKISSINCWGPGMYDVNHILNRRSIKYVDFSFDTRDLTVWLVKLRTITGHEDVSFRVDTKEGVEELMKFLDEPLNPEKEADANAAH